MSGQALVRYDAMRTAITAAHSVDEVKDIRNKAMALELYARQASDMEAERQVREIRVRAERRCGELLSEREMASAGRPPKNASNENSNYGAVKTLADLGISHNQSSQWQRLAAVPDEVFEEELANPVGLPSAGSIVASNHARTHPEAAREPVDQRALWLWGRLQDFKRQGLLDRDPNELCATMVDHMRETVRELTPEVIAWLKRIKT